MSATGQLALDLSTAVTNAGVPLAEGAGLILTPSPHGAIGACDRCHGPTGKTSYGVRVNGKVLLVCGRCDREVSR